MFVIGTVLWVLVIARLAAANPSTPLPWVGWPPNRPRGIRLLQFFAIGSLAAGMNFVIRGFGRLQDIPYHDIFWGVPFWVVAFLVGLVPLVRHNRRVRRAAVRSAESQQTGY
jgi:hypothetical protein